LDRRRYPHQSASLATTYPQVFAVPSVFPHRLEKANTPIQAKSIWSSLAFLAPFSPLSPVDRFLMLAGGYALGAQESIRTRVGGVAEYATMRFWI
jgi:hypothetical protein